MDRPNPQKRRSKRVAKNEKDLTGPKRGEKEKYEMGGERGWF